jgi:hypothetical protein
LIAARIEGYGAFHVAIQRDFELAVIDLFDRAQHAVFDAELLVILAEDETVPSSESAFAG